MGRDEIQALEAIYAAVRCAQQGDWDGCLLRLNSAVDILALRRDRELLKRSEAQR